MPNPIPTSARKAVQERSQGRCERCWGPGGEIHHRRSRRVSDAHTHCLCVLVRLCRKCHHEWAHARPAEAKAEGYAISQFEQEPWLVPLKTPRGVVVHECSGDVHFADGAK